MHWLTESPKESRKKVKMTEGKKKKWNKREK